MTEEKEISNKQLVSEINMLKGRVTVLEEYMAMIMNKEAKPKVTFKEVKPKVNNSVTEKIVIQYDGRTFEKFKPCKYKCGMWASWANDYKQGDKPLHINPVTKEVLGKCPDYVEEE